MDNSLTYLQNARVSQRAKRFVLYPSEILGLLIKLLEGVSGSNPDCVLLHSYYLGCFLSLSLDISLFQRLLF